MANLLKLLKQSKLVQPLSKKGLRQELKAAGQLKYGQELKDLKKERRITRATQKRNDAWFDDYRGKILESQTTSGDNYAAVGQQLANQSQQGYVQDAAQNAGLNAQRSADASLYGAKSAPTGAATQAQAGAFRAAQADAQRSSLAKQGAANFDYLGGRAATAAGSQLAAKIASGKRQQVLREEVRDKKAERQDFKVDLRRELRGAERQFLSDLLANKLGKKGHQLDEDSLAQADDHFSQQLAQENAHHNDEMNAPDPDEPDRGDWKIARADAIDALNKEFDAIGQKGPWKDDRSVNKAQFARNNREKLLRVIRQEVGVSGEGLTEAKAREYLRLWIRRNTGTSASDPSEGQVHN